MEVRQLRYFVTVAEVGHFGRAAERLHIVQPAVSKQIAGLERELGLTLFDRSRRQIRLTPDGEAFLPHARRVLQAVERAGKAAADLVAGSTGILRIGGSNGLGRRLEEILTRFRRAHPGATVELTSTASGPERIAAVLAGDLDAAFVTAMPKAPGLSVHHLWDEPLVLAVPAERAATAADLGSLADLPLARSARDRDPAAFDLITAACEAAGFTPRPGPVVINVQDVLAGPVAAGDCWTPLPAGSAGVDSEAVAFVRPAKPILLPVALALPDPVTRPLAADLLRAAREYELRGLGVR